jgi:hypothetical protein
VDEFQGKESRGSISCASSDIFPVAVVGGIYNSGSISHNMPYNRGSKCGNSGHVTIQ